MKGLITMYFSAVSSFEMASGAIHHYIQILSLSHLYGHPRWPHVSTQVGLRQSEGSAFKSQSGQMRIFMV